MKKGDDISGKDILSLTQFNKSSIQIILKRTDQILQLMKKNKCSDVLKGSVVALLFFEPSTRTFNSFSSAAQRLGAGIISLRDRSISSMVKGETLEDTTRIYSGYADAIIVRGPEKGTAQRVADAADIPVINAGDGIGEHPTQTFLDLYTIQKKFRTLSGLRIAMVGDLKNGRTIHSLLRGLAYFPNNTVYLLAPKQLRLGRELVDELAKNITIVEIQNVRDLPNDMHVWYWTRIQKERFKTQKEYLKLKNSFILTPKLLHERAMKHTIIMHPLPRVNEIDPQVDKDPRAYYFQQARNGLFVRMALLSLVLGKRVR